MVVLVGVLGEVCGVGCGGCEVALGAAKARMAAAIPAVPGAMTAAEVVARVAASGAQHTGIVGFGSLLSADSAALTCPGVRNFRLGRVRGWRRVFGHPAHIFFARGIANPATREIASLCAEPAPDPSQGFVMAAFEVPTSELPALLERGAPPLPAVQPLLRYETV